MCGLEQIWKNQKMFYQACYQFVYLNSVWTVDCFDQLATQRMDPIKFPGQSEAGHVHAIVGASKFELV